MKATLLALAIAATPAVAQEQFYSFSAPMLYTREPEFSFFTGTLQLSWDGPTLITALVDANVGVWGAYINGPQPSWVALSTGDPDIHVGFNSFAVYLNTPRFAASADYRLIPLSVAAPIPEPATWLALLAGLAGLLGRRRLA